MTKINFFLVSTILLTFIIQTKANPKYTNPQGQTAD